MIILKASSCYETKKAPDVLKSTQKEAVSGYSKDKQAKSSPLIHGRKSFLSIPTQANTTPKSSKDTTRPKSFSSFFQHLETKYFPYKQQLSHEPTSTHPPPQSNPELDVNHDGLENQDIEVEHFAKGVAKCADEHVKPKKQKRSMFKNLFMSSSSHQQNTNKRNSIELASPKKLQDDINAKPSENYSKENEKEKIIQQETDSLQQTKQDPTETNPR